jgi:hypothetical protein
MANLVIKIYCWIIYLIIFGLPPLAFSASQKEIDRTTLALAAAKTPEEKGMAIAMENEYRNNGYGDTKNELRLEIINKNGEIKIREYRGFSIELPDFSNKVLAIFDKPDDVQGVAALLQTNKNRPDDLWFYFPSIKRIKRVSSQNRQGSFFGSEFTNEDAVLFPEPEKFRYKWLRDEELDGQMCYVIERYPYIDPSAYKRWVMWFDKEEFRLLKQEMYNKRDEHLKTMYYRDYKLLIEDFWFYHQLYIENHQTEKKSTVFFKYWKLQNGLNESDFSLNALKRLR